MKTLERLAAAAALLLLSACASQPSGPTPRSRLPEPPPAGEPTEFVGMSSAQLQGLLGKPAFTRRENGSALWRYDTTQCRTFFFLYPAGKDMEVRHVETVPQGNGAAADPACLTALRAKPVSQTS